MKLSITVSLIAALVCACMFIIAGCGGAANTTSNSTNSVPKMSNTAASPAASPASNAAPSNTANTSAKTETAPAEDSVGVAECDEYIKKYEACLTKVAAKNPQIESSLKTAFEAQRNGFKTAASTPQGKAALAGVCKQAIDTAKASTSAYACEW